MSTSHQLVVFVAICVVIALLTSVERRREAIRHNLRIAVIAVLAGLLADVVLLAMRYTPTDAMIGGIVVTAVLAMAAPKRSRYIRRSERRRAIARFELETGEKYKPRKHELDHEVPFSRGGSSTADNLRVKTRAANRKKAAKSVWWDLLSK